MPTRHLKHWRLIAFAIGFLLLHGVCLALPLANKLAMSYAYSITAPVLAALTCYRRYRSSAQHVKAAWGLFATGLLLWALGMAMAAWEDLALQVPSTAATLSDLAYFLYGVPILLSISSPTYDRRTAIYFWLDGIQVTLAAFLAYVVIFSVLPFVDQAIEPIPIRLLANSYHVENVVLAGAACLRLLAHRKVSDERAYYATLTLFLCVYAAFAAVYNELSVAAPDAEVGWHELLPDFPFLLLAIAASLPSARSEWGSDYGELAPLPLFIENFSPIFFTASLLALSFVAMREHFYLGMCSAFAALGLQSLRSTFLQNRYIRTEQKLRTARDELEKLSVTDGLTGIGNRRFFDQMLDLEWHRAKRNHTSLALLLIDIDFFKSVNDECGHPYGDTCLVKVAQALRSAAPRNIDILARYGGEEFVAILPETDRSGAELVATKMQEAVAQSMIANAPSRGGYVTVSIGAAAFRPLAISAPAGLVTSADQALYRAKQNGRNRIEYAPIEMTA